MTRAMREAIEDNEAVMENKVFKKGCDYMEDVLRDQFEYDKRVYALSVLSDLSDQNGEISEKIKELTRELCAESRPVPDVKNEDKSVWDDKRKKFVPWSAKIHDDNKLKPTPPPDPDDWMY